MRRTTPPVAGAEGGADCPTGPKRAGSGRLPRRAGGGGGGGEGLRSSVLDSVLVSGAVAKSSPDDDAEELGGAGGGDDRARSVAALVFRLEEYSNEIHEVNLENICSHTQEQTLKRKLEEPGCSNIEEKKRKMGSVKFEFGGISIGLHKVSVHLVKIPLQTLSQGTLSLTETNQSLAEPTTSRQCQDRMGTLSLTETNQSLAEPTTSRQCQDRMEPFTEINTRNKIPINLKRKFSSTELGTSTEEAEMDIASAKKN
ncbi:hypothetical protein MSG28_011174 [Choristoneura fumiferana]|uniref:Uncharacterized protein n=1 Tax=Choristoneura fumiferana TaxID=7141 RepID=A0ACC0KR35_CHOFU|nr:hypothetical protein MSG28_011174 [Choristoneura fumiferana]